MVSSCGQQRFLLYILSVNEKLPASKFQYFGKYIVQLFGYCYVHVSCLGEIKQFHELWNYGARDVRAFYVFHSFKEFEIIIFRRQRARSCPRHLH